jgi:hypothetical protein
VSVCLVVLLGGKGVRVSTPFIKAFPWLLFPRNGPLHLSLPFNTTTLIRPMNKEEEGVPVKDSHVRWNHFVRERHTARSEEQRVMNVSRRAAQRDACSDAQIVTKKPSFEAACIS